MRTGLNIGFATERDSALPSLRLNLEPEDYGHANRATLDDIDQMMVMAKGGLSARNRQVSRCKWASWAPNGDLICTMRLWVWPSDLNLRYELTAPSGVEVSGPSMVLETRKVKFWIAGGRGIDLPWVVRYPVYEFPMHLYDAWSRTTLEAVEIVERPGARLEFRCDEAIYGVLSVLGYAVGYKHEVSVRYPTGDGERAEGAVILTDPAAPLYVAGGGEGKEADGPGISITQADDIDVTATWIDENGELQSETATLQIPDCVRALLEQCPEGSGRGGGIRVRPEGGDGPVAVYYNTCNGKILDIKRLE